MQKKCKGTHKDTYGLGCNKMVNAVNRKLGLGRECLCYSKFLLNTQAGKDRMKRAILKSSKTRLEVNKAIERKKQKDSLQRLIDSVKTICHQYIRLRDANKPCISCNANYNEHFQAGHFNKAEIYSNIRFHEFNINGQCRVCNLHKDGNYEGYLSGFNNRYGLECYNELERLKKKYKQGSFSWDRDELIKIRKYYRSKINELKSLEY